MKSIKGFDTVRTSSGFYSSAGTERTDRTEVFTGEETGLAECDPVGWG